MSGELKLTFASDVPPLAVEVVSPSFVILDRLAVRGGETRVVQAPSEGTFLRIALPTGRTVVLADPTGLDRIISAADLGYGTSTPSSLSADQDFAEWEQRNDADVLGHASASEGQVLGTTGLEVHSFPGAVTEGTEATSISRPPFSSRASRMRSRRALAKQFTESARVTLPGMTQRTVDLNAAPIEIPLHPDPFGPPSTITVDLARQVSVTIRLPGNLKEMSASWTTDSMSGVPQVNIRVASTSRDADAVASFLLRNDLESADIVSQLIKPSLEMLQDKFEDPYSAAIGAYVLLRLGRFTEMRDWPKTLADSFPALADGCVIWSSCLANRDSDSDANITTREIVSYLHKSIDRGFPVYTQGLRFLASSARLVGSDGSSLTECLRGRPGIPIWQSPFDTRWIVGRDADPNWTRAAVDIAFKV